MKKFEETGVVINIDWPENHRYPRFAENIAISESAAEVPNVTIPRRSQELGLSYGRLWRILHLDLHIHPYKEQLTKQLK